MQQIAHDPRNLKFYCLALYRKNFPTHDLSFTFTFEDNLLVIESVSAGFVCFVLFCFSFPSFLLGP